MKISILVSDVSSNCLGRSSLLAAILREKFDVEMIGPAFQTGIWAPLGGEVSCVTVKGGMLPLLFPELIKMLKKITGDVIYANKALLTSYTIGLVKKLLSHKPVVLDIDDWEVPLCLRHNGKRNLLNPNSYWMASFNEKLTRFADAITVCSHFLKRKFGGVLIPHARDTWRLDPAKFDSARSKRELGLQGKRVVGFVGTPRPHKGLEDLISAVATLANDIVLMIVGLGDDAYSSRIRELLRELMPASRYVALGIEPVDRLPFFLSIADVIVIPQRDTPESIAQVPAKVFDAMAMARPIIATNVSDLPVILDGCGMLVGPGSIPELARAIQTVLDSRDYAWSIGKKAREKCVKAYSYESTKNNLIEVFSQFDRTR